MSPSWKKYVGRLRPDQSYLIHEFVDNYEDGAMSRRDLVERVFRITGGTATAASTLLALGVRPVYADPHASVATAPPAQTGPRSPLHVPENDPAVSAGPVTFPNGPAMIMAYLARPNAAGRFPAVMICHENQGIGPHFEDVARRYAKAGYVAIALDLLSRQGGTAAVPANQVGMFISGPGAAERHVSDFQAAMMFLRRQPFVVPDRIGMTGFCFGGGVTWNVAIKDPTLRAAVPYYGTPAFADELANIRAPVLAIVADEARDQRTTSANRSAVDTLSATGRHTVRLIEYAGAGHAFFNDTREAVYHEAASLAAWQETLNWFAIYLRGAALPGTGDAEPAEEDARMEGAEDAGAAVTDDEATDVREAEAAEE